MTIVGTAEIVVDANTQNVGPQIQSGVNAPLQRTGTVAEVQAGRAKKAWGAAASSIGNEFSNQLGGMQQQFQGFTHLISQHGKIIGSLLGGGTAALAAGVVGAEIGSHEQGAMQQLQVAVTNTGASWDQYGKRVEEAVGHGANLAFKSTDVLDALTALTVGLKSPEKALNNLDFAMDIARKQHIDLATAAGIALRANLGLARGLLPLGVNISQDNKLVAAATTAQKAHAAAVQQLADKKRALRQEEERVNASATASAASQVKAEASITAAIKSAEAAYEAAKFKYGYASPQAAAAEARLAAARARTATATGPNVSQEIALSNARKAVADAQQKVADTTKAMRQANEDAKGAQDQINHATEQARHNVDGLAQAHVHTFGGQFDVWKTKIIDHAEVLGRQYGPALIATGFGLQGLAGIYGTTAAIIGRFRNTQVAAAAETAATTTVIEAQTVAMSEEGLAGAISGTESEIARAMPAMAASTEMGMGRMTGAVAGVVGVIGSFGVGASVHGTGGAVAGSLGGAISGAVAGLSVGGPFGAAVGAAGGLLVGLAGHFLGAGHGASQAANDIDAFTQSLKGAYAADKGKLGAQSRAAINQFLQAPSSLAAGLPDLLAQAGVTMREIIKGIREPGSLKSAVAQVNRAYAQGKLTADDFNTLLDALGTIDSQFEGMVTTADSIASINGHVTQHMHDIGANLRKILSTPIGPHPSTGVTSHAGQGYGSLLVPPMAAPHRAGGGDVSAAADYVVGEHGPEVVRFDQPGVVYQHGVTPRGGDGASSQSFDQATHMYLLRLVSAAERQLHATEGIAPQLASRLTQHPRRFESPILATIR